MALSSYDYLAPLLDAHKKGLWGRAERSVLQTYHYQALEILAQEQGVSFRRVKLVAPYYYMGGHLIKEAIIPAMVLFRDEQPVLCDLHGNQTPARVIKAFAKHYELDMEATAALKRIDAWKDAAPLRESKNAGPKQQLDTILNSGRAMLAAFHLKQTPQAETAKSPILRM